MKKVFGAALPLVVISLASWPAYGQSPDVSVYRLTRGTQMFGVWGGQAFSATTVFGGLTVPEARDRAATQIGLHYGRVLVARDSFALLYSGDLIPVEIQYRNVTSERDRFTPTARRTAYGAGLNPLGLKAAFGRGRTKPFVAVLGGFVMFNRRVPLPAATKFTFTGDVNLGADIWSDRKRVYTLGVKFHHISNAGTGDVNRGLNEFVLYGGIAARR